MQPIHIFRFCLIVLLSIIALSFLYPKQGIKLFNHSLEFLSLNDLFNDKKESAPDISGIIADTTLREEKPETEENDTIINDSLHIQHNLASLKLFAGFYEKLANAQKNDQLVRVLHYGDSQIEADRISGTLRENLQRKFGGSGVGLIPITEVTDSRTNVFVKAGDRKSVV